MPATRDELIRRLARQVRDLPGSYTRAFGPEDNSSRVLGLVEADAYALGLRLLAVLDTGVDPGDDRYVCGMVANCRLHRGHSADHEEAQKPS